jgi:hypothetical protein
MRNSQAKTAFQPKRLGDRIAIDPGADRGREIVCGQHKGTRSSGAREPRELPVSHPA